MKIKNSTTWPDYFLRRMVAWCCRQSGLPAGELKGAQFRQRKLKLAQTKCRKLKQRVAYYDKALAATKGPKA